MDSKTIYRLKYHIPKKEFKNQFIDLIFKEVKNKEEVGDNKHIQISNSATYIEEYAFQSCKSLTSIIIPNSVLILDLTIPRLITSIKHCTFYDCDNLT